MARSKVKFTCIYVHIIVLSIFKWLKYICMLLFVPNITEHCRMYSRATKMLNRGPNSYRH